jgi:hypothetical protein
MGFGSYSDASELLTRLCSVWCVRFQIGSKTHEITEDGMERAESQEMLKIASNDSGLVVLTTGKRAL